MEKKFYVYILTTNNNKILYIGVTSSLPHRTNAHKRKLTKSFTSRYNVNKLVYAEPFDDAISAIAYEKHLKTWSRAKKVSLINAQNPEWRDLFTAEPRPPVKLRK